MPTPPYTRSAIVTKIGDGVKGTLPSTQVVRILDDAAREVFSEVDTYSAKRMVPLSLDLANDIPSESQFGVTDATLRANIVTQENDFAFHAPADLKGQSIVDIRKRYARSTAQLYQLIYSEEFERRRTVTDYFVAVDRRSFLSKLLATGIPTIATKILHNCDTYNGNGTWTGTDDAGTVGTETGNFVQGSGGVNFNVAGATTNPATMTNSGFTAVDLSSVLDNGIYLWVYMPSVTGITSFNLRWGTDASNYYARTVTATHDGTAFAVGWNLLRLPQTDATETGSVTDTSIGYLRLQIAKTAAHTASTGWIIDGITAQADSQSQLVYYSRFPWQTSAGVLLLESSADGDYLNASEEELNLFLYKAKMLVSDKLGNDKDVQKYLTLYTNAQATYRMRYPSEALLITETYEVLASLGGSVNTTTTTN